MELELSQTPGFRINCAVDDISDQPNPTHCPKSNQHFLDISGNVEESLILQDIFRVVSRFPRYISCYIYRGKSITFGTVYTVQAEFFLCSTCRPKMERVGGRAGFGGRMDGGGGGKGVGGSGRSPGPM